MSLHDRCEKLGLCVHRKVPGQDKIKEHAIDMDAVLLYLLRPWWKKLLGIK